MAAYDDCLVKLPPFRRSHITKISERLYDVLYGYVGSLLPSSEAKFVAASIARHIKGEGKLCLSAIIMSLDDVLDTHKLSESRVRRCCWRLAANHKALLAGVPVPYEVLRVPPYLAICEVEGLEKIRLEDQLKVRIAYRLLTGPLAGRQHIAEIPLSFTKVIFGVATGFPRGCRFTSPLQLIGLRVVWTSQLFEEEVTLEKLAISSAMRSYNSNLSRKRIRNLSGCPHGRQVDCALCPVGKNECDRSVRAAATQLLRQSNQLSVR